MALKKKAPTKPVAKKKPVSSAPESTEPKRTASGKRVNSNLIKILDEINGKYGKNAISLGVPKNDDGSVKSIQRMPSGSIALDVAMGGGLPVGRYIEISGMLSSTKTTLCIHIAKAFMDAGHTVLWLDIEGTTDEAYFRACGIGNADEILYSRPDGMEEALEMADYLTRQGVVQLIVIDSIAMLSPTKEQDKEMGESTQMGVPQKILGEYFRKLASANNRIAREGGMEVTVIGVNQLREKIGAYGDPEYSPGGRAKGFAQSIDIRLRRGDWITKGSGQDKEVIGQTVKFKIEKNKTFKRMQVGEMDFYFDENPAGVPVNHYDNMKSTVLLAVQWGIIQKAGAWFNYGDDKYQGVVKLVEDLRNNPKKFEKLKKEIYDMTAQKLVTT